MRSWIRDARGPLALLGAGVALLGAGAGCEAPLPSAAVPAETAAPRPPAAKPPCEAVGRHLDEARVELAAGRLLRVLAHGDSLDAACPEASKQLAELSLAAASSLGDAAAVKRWSGDGALAVAPPRFHPDGPITVFPTEGESGVEYGRAVLAYEAGAWAKAGELALQVGAAGGALAGDAFVLAGRSAEKAGDAPRAARMWARAYQAACSARPSDCVPRWPEDDAFGLAARYGRYVPWFSSALCRGDGRTVVGGTWEVTWAGARFEIHEVPSRVLLESGDAGGASPFCLSRDGKRRVGLSRDLAGKRAGAGSGLARRPDTVVFEVHDGASTRVPVSSLPDWFSAEPRNTYVLDDGGALFVVGDALWVFDASTAKIRRVAASPPASVAVSRPGELGWLSGSLGERGSFYAYFPEPRPPLKAPKAGVMRYDLATGKGVVAYEGELADYSAMGPADEQGRFLVYDRSHLRWVDGAAGKVLAEMKVPDDVAYQRAQRLGVVPPATLVWVGQGAPGSPHGVYTADVTKGTVEIGGLTWRPGADSAREGREAVTMGPQAAPNPVARVLGDLPAGSSSRTWSSFPGWSVGWIETPIVDVDVRGRKDVLRVVLTADRKGALVVAPDSRRFELIGQVPGAFRASVSCGGAARHDLPRPGDRAWPIEVCGAVLETPGLTEALLGAAGEVPR